MVVLGLLAAEDLKYKAVTVWKLVLFAAILGVVLGVLLAIAARMK